ncbi:uncharacterized protein RHO25_007145 [Cercospora beticola]|uniref:Actin-like ATPase domain-containing protein n=1 Tax=Cercospora beticola TaxID=122368 RepID=A0ABZ0NST6_CERBT|nr:hypothetical protein RHO25_007145 [Cercospora beticola]
MNLLALFRLIAPVTGMIGTPRCKDCLPVAIHDAPGIGIDLSFSYATSSVRYYGGAIADGAVVEAPQEYTSLMLQLSTAPEDQATYSSRLQRRLNKFRGLPSTLNVGIIGSMIRRVKQETEAKLKITLDQAHIVVTHPLLPGLSHEDIGDAIEFAGLKSWLHKPNIDSIQPKVLIESRATFGANGYNLCSGYTNVHICQEENLEDMTWETVYFVSLSRTVLYTTIVGLNAPFTTPWSREHSAVHPEVGTDMMGNYSSEADYWDALQQKLVPEERDTGYPISLVLLAGDSIEIPEAREALMKALGDRLGPPYTARTSKLRASLVAYAPPVYAAARGAALYARWRQEVPYGCAEGLGCEWQREADRKRIKRGINLKTMVSEL